MTGDVMEAPTKILVPVDLSKRSELAISYGAMLAAQSGAELILTINVNMPERAVIEDFAGGERVSIEEAGRAALHRLASRLAPDVETSLDLRFRDFPAEGILDAAESLEVDMIVVASHGRAGMSRWLLGSVAEKIARGAEVPVVIVPARA